jgi:hypothetical protein
MSNARGGSQQESGTCFIALWEHIFALYRYVGRISSYKFFQVISIPQKEEKRQGKEKSRRRRARSEQKSNSIL